jgi:hypothetical protein
VVDCHDDSVSQAIRAGLSIAGQIVDPDEVIDPQSLNYRVADVSENLVLTHATNLTEPLQRQLIL